MLRRSRWHDYSDRAIYLVTLLAEKPYVLGKLSGGTTNAHIKVTNLGGLVLDALDILRRDFPQVQILAYQVMPDHLHLVLFVRERLPFPLGRVIAGFKGNCNKRFAAFLASKGVGHNTSGAAGLVAWSTASPSVSTANDRQATTAAEPPHTQRYTSPAEAGKRPAEHAQCKPRLWQPGFNDRILKGRDQLRHMIDYVKDNPRRLAVRRAASPFFKRQLVNVGGQRLEAVGNLALLRTAQRVQVYCSRRMTPEEIAEASRRRIAEARAGALLVSPCISPGEKTIIHTAINESLPVVLLRNNGFATREKPTGVLFDACAEGRLLVLAIHPHDEHRHIITRQECISLNLLATAVCSEANIITQSL